MTDLPLSVRVSGPLGCYAHGFAVELAGQGYTPLSVKKQLGLMAHASHWLDGEGLDASMLTPVAIERFLATRRAAGYAHLLSRRALVPLLGYLRSLDAAPPPATAQMPSGSVEQLLERYRCFLRDERGLAAGTIRGYVDAVRPFLAARASADGLALESLGTHDVSAFVVSASGERQGSSPKVLVPALRGLLGFLHIEGLCGPLAGAVPSIASWRLASLPKRLQPEDVRRLLESCDRRRTAGLRDFAILLLLSRLGLRAGEVAALELDDVNWRTGEIVVRGKGDRQERLPLPVDVGEAMIVYLQRGRPSSALDRGMFVRLWAPHRALSSGAVSSVVAIAGRRAGLGRMGAHRLRHTAASDMLRAGAPLGEIGQVLRHRDLQSTAIYAKVDREALRSLARRWIGGAA